MTYRGRQRGGGNAKGNATRNIMLENFQAGCNLVANDPLLGALWGNTWCLRDESGRCPGDGWATVSSSGHIYVHPTRRGEPKEWAYVLAHCLLHLGFNHFQQVAFPAEWNAACDCYITAFLERLKFGSSLYRLDGEVTVPTGTEERIYEQFCERGIPPELQVLGTAGAHPDMIFDLDGAELKKSRQRWAQVFGEGLSRAVTSAVEVAAGIRKTMGAASTQTRTLAQQARSWFISSYPLLGALAASFTIIEDPLLCTRLEVSVAAVHAESKEIYINPAAGLNMAQHRFVMAHELLHVGLRHEARRQGRDPYLWNVACFPAGTWISCGKPIEDVATMERMYDGELIHIEAQCGEVSCTPEHPFYVRRRIGKSYPISLGTPSWVDAKDICQGDYLLVPLIHDKVNATSIDLRGYIREGTDTLGRKTFSNRAVKEIPLDEDTAWLIGLYVAEGSSSPHPKFSLGAHEVGIADRVRLICARIGYSVSMHVHENTLELTVGAVVLGRWLKDHCGKGAHTKHVPQVILAHANPAIRAAFIEGLVAGDGHINKQTTSSTLTCMVGSVSERLIADVVLLLAQDGLGGAKGILRRGPRMIGKTWTDKPLILHTFHWNPKGIAITERVLNGKRISSYSHRWKIDEYGIWYRVRAVSTEPFQGTVYNLTTATHTYIANGFLVHNCDYVINAWLIEMGVGEVPPLGLLYDPELKGLSAEAIYDRIVNDLRHFRKLRTFRGVGLGDIFDSEGPDWWMLRNGVDLDAFYRRALAQGLEYHKEQGRGFLPGDLEEEIRALSQPPIPWDVELARWFADHFPLPEKLRSYAHPSRHQSATPDIPRPRWVPPPDWEDGRTFGVLLDTSGSMDRVLLAKALGAIASYSIAREVPAVRLVFCDVVTYDEGYLAPEAIADRVRVRGRGGTILQPGVDLLERAEDFPKDGPLLIITDGLCDSLHVYREHAFLLPKGHRLPFPPHGEVFYIE